MSVARQTGNTIVALLGTVNTAAQQITRTVNITGSGLDMLDTYVSAAKIKQEARTKVDLFTFKTSLLEDSSMDIAKRQEALALELNANAGLKALFAENHQKLEALLG